MKNITNNQPQESVLYVVATPIGNLGDISSRAIEVLNNVDLILAEDTRKFHRLAVKYSITTPTKSYYDHNEEKRSKQILDSFSQGKTIALVSEAGTPNISDPGYRITKRCREEKISVITIPGPCAAVAALSICGFEVNRFLFEGFLPQKSGKRKKLLQATVESGITTVFYESPYRIMKTLEFINEISPTQEVFIGRELTKMYEESLNGTALEVLDKLKQKQKVKGEFVLILRGATSKQKKSNA